MGAVANQQLQLTGAAFRFRAAWSRCSGPGKSTWSFGDNLTSGNLMEQEGRPREAIITADEVPFHLRELIPSAEEWGTWNPHRCDEIIEQKPNAELRPFVQLVERHRGAIDAWLDTMPKDMKQWPNAAVIFLYLIRNWNEAACELYGRETYGNAEPGVPPDCGGIT
jgi:hypothetical protein